jgi:hypothetical protein
MIPSVASLEPAYRKSICRGRVYQCGRANVRFEKTEVCFVYRDADAHSLGAATLMLLRQQSGAIHHGVSRDESA